MVTDRKICIACVQSVTNVFGNFKRILKKFLKIFGKVLGMFQKMFGVFTPSSGPQTPPLHMPAITLLLIVSEIPSSMAQWVHHQQLVSSPNMIFGLFFRLLMTVPVMWCKDVQLGIRY